jgi:hypothetical protein
VGKISPKVPPAWITLMNHYKQQMIAGKIVPPATIGK